MSTEQRPFNTFRWSTPLDNYEPMPRDTAYGEAHHFAADADGGRGETIRLVLRDTGLPASKAFKAAYLLDDGRTVSAWYVSGWNPRDGEEQVHLQRFPVNVNPDGSPRLRGDRPEPVDFSNWALGPRLTFHIKVQDYSLAEIRNTCRFCQRLIINDNGTWIDPQATGDDSIWRETCDAHDTFVAEHEPDPTETITFTLSELRLLWLGAETLAEGNPDDGDAQNLDSKITAAIERQKALHPERFTD
jgi:hypothetical protein